MNEMQLLYAARNGDGDALEALLCRFKNLVKSKASAYYLMGGDRDDIIQEGMIGLFKAIRDYDADKNASFSAFAELCVNRQIMTAIKTSARRKHQPLNNSLPLDAPSDSEGFTTGSESDPETLLIDRESFNDVGMFLRKNLSDMEYRVMMMYVQGLPHADIANVLDKDKKSVDNTLQRARKKMEKVVRN